VARRAAGDLATHRPAGDRTKEGRIIVTTTPQKLQIPRSLRRFNAVYPACKITVEWLLALLSLVLLAPFLAAAAILVKVSSGGPALYSQTRLGKGGRTYRVYKIRTMVHQAEAHTGAVWAAQNDPRVTPIGRFLRDAHLDELPQLWNILRGEMSLIGPRPERPEIATQLETLLPDYRQRLLVRPGLTGLAQLRLPADSNVIGVRRKLSCDLYYVRRQGFRLDLRIAVSTLFYLLGRLSKSVSEMLIRSHGAEADHGRDADNVSQDHADRAAPLRLRLPRVRSSQRGAAEPAVIEGVKAA
jgi:lipopolysaccharide/colanic/teichoic acid biosynthesis glycosyltransferase